MTTTIDPTIGRTGAWAEGVQRANHILEMILKDWREPLTATWTLVSDDRGGPSFLKLTLADTIASVERQFSSDELEDGEQLWSQLRRLWGDLLQARAQWLVDDLYQSMPALEGK